MNIIQSIRKICTEENGFYKLFNKNEGFKLLKQFCNEDTKQAENFSILLYGNARQILLQLIQNAFSFEQYTDKIIKCLIKEGLTNLEAKQTIENFYKAFAFPKYKDIDINTISEFVCYEKNKFKMIYKGECVGNIENGIGTRNQYYDGKWCGEDESLFLNGKMVGYCYFKELELESFLTIKEGFVIDDYFIGTIRFTSDDGEVGYLEGNKLEIN